MSKKLKEVKIDEILKASKTKNIENSARRGRGRPRKSELQAGQAESQRLISSNDAAQGTSSNSAMGAIDPKNDQQAQLSSQVVPIYDTTEEAKAFIQGPFEIAAALTKYKDFKLFSEELEAITPSFKLVYDKRIKPSLGENADIYAFAVVFAGIAAKKAYGYSEWKKSQEKTEQDYSAVNGIPSEGCHEN